MLADGVEASVRSLASRDEPAIRAMVTRIIEERTADGQFDECDLTLRDLERIREAFVEQLLGHVPHAHRVPAEHGRRARVAPAAAGGGGGGQRRERPGLVTRALYVGAVAGRLTVRDGVVAPVSGAALARAIGAAVDAAGAPSPASIGLILTDDAELAELNAAHLGVRGPTDVLSFPLLPPEAFPAHIGGTDRSIGTAGAFPLPPGRRPHLGDIVISVERAIEQAEPGRGGQTGDVRGRPPTSSAARDPRHAPPLRLGPRRAGRGGRDARARDETASSPAGRAGVRSSPPRPARLGERPGRPSRRLLPSKRAHPERDRALSCCLRRVG